MKNEEIEFIARHYREGHFSAAEGWRKLGIAHISYWKRFRVAAAVAVAVILSATATILYREYRIDDVPQRQETVNVASPLAEVKVIDFENAPLAEVVDKIEMTYNVRVENVPDSSDNYVLSLHYEGTPSELVAVINDILGTQMTVAER